jgi:DNA polymerase-3 subunit beta
VRLACDRESLVTVLARACRVATTRPAVRILGAVRLVAVDDVLRVTATDLELTVSSELDVRGAEAGVAVVPGRPLLAVVQAIDGELVELVANGTTLEIRSGDSTFCLNTMPPEDFPEPPALGDAIELELDSELLRDTVGRMVRVASTDHSRPVYTGVRLTAEGTCLTLVATDGYRLATATAELREPAEAFDVLVPARVLAEVVKLAAGATRVGVQLTASLIGFTAPGCALVARTLEGRPQDHARILDAPFAFRAGVPRATLLRAVDRAALLADRGGAVELRFDSDEILVRARSAELGRAEERVALAETGPTLRIGFNSRYLRDGLDLVSGEKVWLEMNDGLRPIVIHGASDEFRYLVAPLRLPESI